MSYHLLPIFGVVNGRCACGNVECASPGKHPIGRLVPNGLKDASADEADLERWRKAEPTINVAIATGPSGVVVLDVDGEDGLRSLRDIQDEWGELPVTRKVLTGRGFHLYFTNTGDPVPCSTSRVGPGLDVRGEGGYVLAPGSSHVSGASYRLEIGPEAALPGWLRKLMLPAPKVVAAAPRPTVQVELSTDQLRRASAYLAKMDGAVTGEGGHDKTWNAAIHMFGFGLSIEQVYALLASEYNPRCSPPWSEKELRHKVENAAAARIGGGFHLERDTFVPAPMGTSKRVEISEPPRSARNLFDLAMEYWKLRRENNPFPSAPTGFPELDKRIGGLRAGRLYIITADTKSGKTSLATQWMWSALEAGVPAQMFSMEMTCGEVFERIAVQRTHISREGALSARDAQALTTVIHALNGMGNAAMVDERARLTIDEMRERTRAWLEREDVSAWRKGPIRGVILVDYLQLSGSTRKNATKEQETAEVSQGLKEIAKEHGVAVVALAQLNRAGTLRHSGQIEQDADCVIRIHPPAVENANTVRMPGAQETYQPVRDMVLTIERIRNGRDGSIPVTFDGPMTSFKEKPWNDVNR